MKKFSAQVKDFHDKFHVVDRTIIVETTTERMAELHALQSLKGLKSDSTFVGGFIPNEKIKVVKIKEIKDKKGDK